MQSGYGRFGEGVTKVRVGTAIVFPKQLDIVRLGYIECEQAATSSTKRSDQNSVPSSIEKGIADDRCSVDEILVGTALVADAGKLVKLFEYCCRDESELFHAGFDVETMQHAIVGSNINSRVALVCLCLECAVVAAGFDGVGQISEVLGRSDHGWRRVHDVP